MDRDEVVQSLLDEVAPGLLAEVRDKARLGARQKDLAAVVERASDGSVTSAIEHRRRVAEIVRELDPAFSRYAEMLEEEPEGKMHCLVLLWRTDERTVADVGLVQIDVLPVAQVS